jgi:hypothetical protein
MSYKRISNIILCLFVLSCIVASGCVSTYSTVKNPVGYQSTQSGTTVPFSKVMNPSFARSYIKSDIITEVEFLSSSFQGFSFEEGDVPDGYFPFQVTIPGGNLSSTQGDIVFAPKSLFKTILPLKPGDLITLRGGTLVRVNSLFTKAVAYWGMVGDRPRVFFQATNCTTAATKVASN